MARTETVVTVDQDIADLIPVFMESRGKDIQQLRQALVENEFERMRKIGHTMKGAGGGYGFQEITDIGAAIETAAQNGEADTIRHQVSRLGDYLDNLRIVYE